MKKNVKLKINMDIYCVTFEVPKITEAPKNKGNI